MECSERGHVAGGAAARLAGGSRALPPLAAPQTSYEAGVDVSLGHLGPRQSRFRDLDEDGYAVSGQLVALPGLEDHATHAAPDRHRQGRALSSPGITERLTEPSGLRGFNKLHGRL